MAGRGQGFGRGRGRGDGLNVAVTITDVGLIAAYPEWANAPAGVLANVLAVANAKVFELYEPWPDLETDRRYLEAGAMLYSYPFARDMQPEHSADLNPYRALAQAQDVIHGGAYRGPGWTLPAGVS